MLNTSDIYTNSFAESWIILTISDSFTELHSRQESILATPNSKILNILKILTLRELDPSVSFARDEMLLVSNGV